MPRRHSVWGVYTREKYPCKNLGVKGGGGRLLEGDIFSELTVQHSCTMYIVHVCTHDQIVSFKQLLCAVEFFSCAHTHMPHNRSCTHISRVWLCTHSHATQLVMHAHKQGLVVHTLTCHTTGHAHT